MSNFMRRKNDLYWDSMAKMEDKQDRDESRHFYYSCKGSYDAILPR